VLPRRHARPSSHSVATAPGTTNGSSKALRALK